MAAPSQKLRTIRATRYVTPLREGGSLPALVEGDDLGLYVLKFRGAGQGPLALVAELIGGEIGRALGLKVPELVFVEVAPELGRNEPDQEIQELIKASVGLNLALDFLPGSLMFDPAAGDRVSPELAAQAVWFDAFITNVDRTAKNPNLLLWHRDTWFIDHGAALYFQHNWSSLPQMAESRFAAIRQHILLPWATPESLFFEQNKPRNEAINEASIEAIVRQIPDAWLASPDPSDPLTPADRRAGYVEFFTRRLASASAFMEEAIRARAELV